MMTNMQDPDCLVGLHISPLGRPSLSLSKFILHPLMHNTALKKLAQNVVGNPNEADCGLKYVI